MRGHLTIRSSKVTFIVAFFAAIFALLIPLNSAHAVDPSAYGLITNSSGQPLAGVNVIALQNGNVASSTVSDSSGHYAMYLADGTYTFNYAPETSTYTSLSSLPITLPQNWPLNVVLTQPSVGKVFIKGFLGTDDGIAAASPTAPATVMCNNGGNQSDGNGYFNLAQAAGTSCSFSFTGSETQNSLNHLNFNLAQGPAQAINQDTYIEALVPTTSTSIRVIDSTGHQLNASDGLVGVQLDVGGETYTNAIKTVGGKLVSTQIHKTYSSGIVSMFGGTQQFQTTWSAASSNLDSSGNISMKRIAMTSNVTGLATIFINNSKWINGVQREVQISATGGVITVVAEPNSVATLSGKITNFDGTPAAGVSVGSGVTGVNTGATTDANGNYLATFPTGSLSSYFSLGGQKTFSDGSTLGWNYQINFPSQVLNGNINQDFVIPKTTTQQITVVDGNGNPLPAANVQIGIYSTSGPDYSGDPSYPLVSNLPNAKLSWNSTSKTNSLGVVQIPAMPMSSPQSMWVTVAPTMGSWQVLNTLVKIGNGPLTIQVTRPTVSISGSITSSDGIPIPTPQVGYGLVPAPTGVSGGGVNADSQGNYLFKIPQGSTFTYNISSRPQNINNPDPLGFNLTSASNALITATSNMVQSFVLPISYQKVEVVDPSGNPIVGAKVSLNGGSDSARAIVNVAPNLAAFSGTFWGYSTTGLDGYASIPGLVNAQLLPATINVTTDANSRYLSKSISAQVGDRKDIVIVLAIKPPAITTISARSVNAGQTFSVSGSGFLGATSVTIGGVPANYTVTSNTQITVAAPSNTTGGSVVIANGGGTATSASTITVVQPALTISTSSLPNANQSVAYQTSLSASGGVAPYTWSRIASGLPNGLTISSSGLISGTPLQAGTWSFTLGVTDANNKSLTRVYSITVIADPKLIPDTPVGLNATQAAGRINISWNPIINDHGNPILGYQIQTSTNQSNWTTQVANTSSSTASASFPMVVGTYYVRIAAINASGMSGFSSAAGPVTIAGAPSAPTGVSVSLVNGSIRTSWIAPSNGGSPITGYRIRYSSDKVNWTTAIANTASTSTTYSFTPPAKGIYFVEVAGINAVDLGTYSISTSSVQIS